MRAGTSDGAHAGWAAGGRGAQAGTLERSQGCLVPRDQEMAPLLRHSPGAQYKALGAWTPRPRPGGVVSGGRDLGGASSAHGGGGGAPSFAEIADFPALLGFPSAPAFLSFFFLPLFPLRAKARPDQGLWSPHLSALPRVFVLGSWAYV